MLSCLSAGDKIRLGFSQEDNEECETEVIVATPRGVRVDATNSMGVSGNESEGLWIAYRNSVNEDYPVILAEESSNPHDTIHEIEIIEENSPLG